ncbi:hypothetical protein C0580_05220 [Candidatus Parcubacteria bacterium]|nr:MAG: hypothetical protein C0580_05220 [Candidatus Parcubacteria bacterium]
MRNKSIIRIALASIAILLIPFLAMQVTSGVSWNFFDFVFMGFFLFTTGLTYELVAKKSKNITYRVAVAAAILAVFLLVWINGAVGIIGSENNSANLLYFGVIFILVIGSAIANLQAAKMAKALFITAIAQALVPMIALIIFNPQSVSWGANGVLGVFIVNTFFVLLFVLSALLFLKASK